MNLNPRASKTTLSVKTYDFLTGEAKLKVDAAEQSLTCKFLL